MFPTARSVGVLAPFLYRIESTLKCTPDSFTVISALSPPPTDTLRVKPMLSVPGIYPVKGAQRAEFKSALDVPFPSTLEAEIARGSLAPDAEPHRGAVRKELTVSGSLLAVRWRAEDSRLLRISIVNFLDQLALVMRTLQRFGPPVSR
ncbi:hypothetical protein CB1_002650002 [Camelus ferus]|nr:hypothetical protein CB1_002650002 [Camelus ferus]